MIKYNVLEYHNLQFYHVVPCVFGIFFANYLPYFANYLVFACFAGRKEVFARFANSFSNRLVKHFLFGQTLRTIGTFCKLFAKLY